jgi:hypothetical protein
MSRKRVTCFAVLLVLFCGSTLPLKGGGDGYYAESYRAYARTASSERRFEQIVEQRDIKMAINTLTGEGFTSREIEDAVQNRFLRIGSSWPGHFCSASGKIGEPGEGTVVGPTYYLIIGRARILRWFRQTGYY